MNSQPFDLDKMDYEKQRRIARKKLIRASVIPVIICFLFILWFGLPTPLTHQAIKLYQNDAFTTARQRLAPLTITSPERFIIEFNSGTVDTKAGNYERAEEELNRALSLAPPDKVCMTAQNLAYSLQEHSKAINQSDSKKANELKAKMRKVTKKHPDCFEDNTQNTGGGGGGGGGSTSQNEQNDAPTESQQEALQQKEQAGRDLRSKQADQDALDLDNPNIKRW